MDITQLKTLLILSGIGIIIALGQLLHSSDNLTWRAGFGRALLNAGLAVIGGSVLLLFPQAPLIAVIGVGAAIATLGTHAVEVIFDRIAGGKNGKV